MAAEDSCMVLFVNGNYTEFICLVNVGASVDHKQGSASLKHSTALGPGGRLAQ